MIQAGVQNWKVREISFLHQKIEVNSAELWVFLVPDFHCSVNTEVHVWTLLVSKPVFGAACLLPLSGTIATATHTVGYPRPADWLGLAGTIIHTADSFPLGSIFGGGWRLENESF